jgi:hypothetical protein
MNAAPKYDHTLQVGPLLQDIATISIDLDDISCQKVFSPARLPDTMPSAAPPVDAEIPMIVADPHGGFRTGTAHGLIYYTGGAWQKFTGKSRALRRDYGSKAQS